MEKKGLFTVGVLSLAMFLISGLWLAETEKEVEASHGQLVASWSVMTELVNGMPGMHTFSDQFGCAVVTKYDDGVARVKRFRICPGGEVFTTWDSEASVKYNRGDDPYWVNLGKPEKEAR